MWLCTTLGFFSIVRKEYETFHIRARSRADLESLLAALGKGSATASRPALQCVTSYPGSDYPWRILCPASELPRVFTTLQETLCYENFKS